MSGYQTKGLQAQLKEERNRTELAQAELQSLKIEGERQRQREGEGRGRVYLKNIVLGYVTNSGDRTRLLPVLAELCSSAMKTS